MPITQLTPKGADGSASPKHGLRPNCRLCGGPVERQFALRVLDKYDVDYHRCTVCQSLQSAEPFWLAETYSGNLPNLDAGAARRALRTCAIVLLVTKLLGIQRTVRLLDFGGGDGLTCRLLRDVGFEAFNYDKYARNFYADGYAGDPNEHYEIVCAVELLEYLSHPGQEIEAVFAQRPRLVVVATDFYHGQGPDWPYLGPEQGGHVFFYSTAAIDLLATRFGYAVVAKNGTAIFSQLPMPRWQRYAITSSLHPAALLAGRIWMQTIRPRR